MLVTLNSKIRLYKPVYNFSDKLLLQLNSPV